jgi:hypothetical protein
VAILVVLVPVEVRLVDAHIGTRGGECIILSASNGFEASVSR